MRDTNRFVPDQWYIGPEKFDQNPCTIYAVVVYADSIRLVLDDTLQTVASRLMNSFASSKAAARRVR